MIEKTRLSILKEKFYKYLHQFEKVTKDFQPFEWQKPKIILCRMVKNQKMHARIMSSKEILKEYFLRKINKRQ